MKKINIIILMLITLPLFVVQAQAAQSVKLFGVPLSTATRAKLEPVLIKAGFIPLSKYIHTVGAMTFDAVPLNPIELKGHLRYVGYRTTGQLKGAHELAVGYTLSGRFAIAKYFIDSLYNSDVLAMLKDKYGKPGYIKALGPFKEHYEYIWNEEGGIKIVLKEEFFHTVLKIINVPECNIRLRQVKEEIKNSDKAVAKAEGGAF
ncbi:MAG: hypothetical protein ACYCSB_01155 [bacterium]|jgi:hypothetical protein